MIIERNEFDIISLVAAVMVANKKILQGLFEYDVHIDVKDGAPLEMAVTYNPRAIPFLVQKGAKKIDNACQAAAREGNVPAAQQLLKVRASLKSKSIP